MNAQEAVKAIEQENGITCRTRGSTFTAQRADAVNAASGYPFVLFEIYKRGGCKGFHFANVDAMLAACKAVKGLGAWRVKA